jgi:hypothetical protein
MAGRYRPEYNAVIGGDDTEIYKGHPPPTQIYHRPPPPPPPSTESYFPPPPIESNPFAGLFSFIQLLPLLWTIVAITLMAALACVGLLAYLVNQQTNGDIVAPCPTPITTTYVSLELIASHRANHATYASVSAASPEGSYVFFVPAGSYDQAPPDNGTRVQLANIFYLAGATLVPSLTVYADPAFYGGAYGGGASRSSKRFATVELSNSTTDMRLSVYNQTSLIVQRRFNNTGPCHWTGLVQPSFTDDDAYVVMCTSPLAINETQVFVMNAVTLATVATLNLTSSAGNTDGYFFSLVSITGTIVDYLAVMEVIKQNPGQQPGVFNSTLLLYQFTRTPSFALTLVTYTLLPAIPLSVSVVPYFVPNTAAAGSAVKLLVTTAQADLTSEVTLRQSDAIAPSFIATDGNEARVYSFSGTASLPLLYAEDTGSDTQSGSFFPGDDSIIALALSPEQTEYYGNIQPPFVFTDNVDASCANYLALQHITDSGAFYNRDTTFAIGNEAHVLGFNALGNILVTSTCKGPQNYNSRYGFANG